MHGCRQKFFLGVLKLVGKSIHSYYDEMRESLHVFYDVML